MGGLLREGKRGTRDVQEGVQVGVAHLFPAPIVVVVDLSFEENAGVVDDDAKTAEFFGDGVDEILDACLVADVEGTNQDPVCRKSLDGLLKGCFGSADSAHRGPLFQEGPGDGPA